jgi:hypothetical protein
MVQAANPLHNLHVASPCPASWDRMQGNDKVRFCSECRLNVYNLSAMSRREAEEMVRDREGRLCVRFYQRADGTVLTQDCPRGLASIQHATRWALLKLTGLVAAMLFLMFGLLMSVTAGRARVSAGANIWQMEPFRTIDSLLPWSQQPPCVVGDLAPTDPDGPGENNAPIGPNGPPRD